MTLDRDTVQIAAPKIVQAKIDSQPREKALQAAAEEKVFYGQLGIRQWSILEANSEAIDPSTLKAKEDISAALSIVEEAKAAVDKWRWARWLRHCTSTSTGPPDPSTWPGIITR